MKTTLIAALAVMVLVVQAKPSNAENAYCSEESANERWLSDERTMLMNLILMVIASKAECDLLTDADVDALHSFHETRGCNRDTPFGQYIQSFVDGDNAAKLNELVLSVRRHQREDRATYFARYEEVVFPTNIVPLVEMANQAEPTDVAAEFWRKFP